VKRIISIPVALHRAAKRKKVDPAELAELILRTLDASLVEESAKILKESIDIKNRR